VDELPQVEIEIRDHPGADGVGALAALLPIGQGFECGDARGDAAHGIAIQGLLKIFVRKRDPNSLTELFTIHR
jgi:hypothetical protein